MHSYVCNPFTHHLIKKKKNFTKKYINSFYLLRCWKKWPAKLKSWRVGWVLSVRRGKVEKKAWATKEAANRLSISTRSPRFRFHKHATINKIGTNHNLLFFSLKIARHNFEKNKKKKKWRYNPRWSRIRSAERQEEKIDNNNKKKHDRLGRWNSVDWSPFSLFSLFFFFYLWTFS